VVTRIFDPTRQKSQERGENRITRSFVVVLCTKLYLGGQSRTVRLVGPVARMNGTRFLRLFVRKF